MTDARLDGFYLLMAEDDPVLGPMMAALFEDEGAEVAGPWATVRAATLALKTRTPDAALLDVNLKDGEAYPLALAFQVLGVPYAFLSASAPSEMPAALHPVSFLEKPASYVLADIWPTRPRWRYIPSRAAAPRGSPSTPAVLDAHTRNRQTWSISELPRSNFRLDSWHP